jgi:hypothetical protein
MNIVDAIQNCDRCEFQHAAECHRFPPIIVVSVSLEQAFFPPVRPDWWCGEFKRREKRSET